MRRFAIAKLREIIVKHSQVSRIFILGLLFLAFAVALSAQEATIVGTVTDPSGAAIPGVQITVTNNETGQIRHEVSNDAGQYVVPSLANGKYSVKAEASGFKTAEQKDVVLNVGDRARVDIALQVGETRESVNVEAAATRVQSDSSEVSEVVTGQQVTELAANGRNMVSLAALIPGASSSVPAFNGPSAQGSNFILSFNGQRPDHNLWMADGGEDYDRGSGGKFEIMPSIDAIAEFTTLTSNYAADYGLNSGATLSVVFKSGTRDFHGGMWEFFRNDALDANNFFFNSVPSNAGKPPAELRYNVFGFNIGGPVLLPHYNKDRNKTFFFYNEEWRRQIVGGVFSTASPDAAMDGGVFPSSMPIKVPTALNATELARFTALGLVPGQPFPNNTIPASLISPLATAFIATGAFNPPNTTSNGVPTFIGGGNAPTDVGEQIVRIDHQFSDKFWIFGHWVSEQLSQTYGTSLWSGDSFPSVGSVFGNPTWAGVIHATYAINPNMVNEVAFNANGNTIDVTPDGIYQRTTAVNPPRLFTGPDADNRLPAINLSNGIGATYDVSNYPWTNGYKNYEIREDLSWNHGRHSFKFGGLYMFATKYQQLFGDTQGNFSFNGTYTGIGFADFLLGYASSYNELAVQDSGHWANNTMAAYVKDDWRVNNRLTLNLGLRWEGIPHTYEQNHRMSDFYPNLYNPADAGIVSPTTGLISPGSPGLAPGVGAASALQLYQNGMGITGVTAGAPNDIVNNGWNNWGPRLGFAYDLTGNGKTVVRGGFGIMYERVQGNDVYNMGPNVPFSASPTVSNVYFNNPAVSLLTGTAAATPITTSSITGENQTNYRNPTSDQWSMGVQHELWHGVVASVSYVGNVGFHQSEASDINAPLYSTSNLAQRLQVIAGTLNVDAIRPYQGYDAILMYDDGGRSKYNGLQTELRMQATHGLTLQVGYTYSKAYDTSSGVAVNGNSGDLDNLSNPYNRAYDWGLSSNNRTNIFFTDYVYNIPIFAHSSNKAAKTLVGGWTLSGVFTADSGVPYTATLGGNTLGMGGDVTNRPNQSGAVSTVGTINEWFNVSAFTDPTLGLFGTAGKDTITGPGRWNFDTSLFKDFSGIKWWNPEGATLEIRFETFNTLNHTQWNGLSTTASFNSAGQINNNFGAITSAFDPRVIQLGAKFLF